MVENLVTLSLYVLVPALTLTLVTGHFYLILVFFLALILLLEHMPTLSHRAAESGEFH